MNLEDRFRDLRPKGPEEGLRARVLAAARSARREQRLWRWTWAVAAAVLAIAIPVNAALDPAAPPPRLSAPPPFSTTADEGLRLRWHLAVTSRPRPFLPRVMQ